MYLARGTLDLVFSAAAGTAGAFSAVTSFVDAPLIERLGTAGMLVVAAGFMLKHYIGVAREQRQQIAAMQQAHLDSMTVQNAQLVEHLKGNMAVNQQVAVALEGLRVEIARRSLL